MTLVRGIAPVVFANDPNSAGHGDEDEDED